MRILQKLWVASNKAVMSGTLLLVFLAFSVPALANDGSAPLKIKVGIVQCGKTAELVQTCRQDSRCCALLDQQAKIQSQSSPKTYRKARTRPGTDTTARNVSYTPTQ